MASFNQSLMTFNGVIDSESTANIFLDAAEKAAIDHGVSRLIEDVICEYLPEDYSLRTSAFSAKDLLYYAKTYSGLTFKRSADIQRVQEDPFHAIKKRFGSKFGEALIQISRSLLLKNDINYTVEDSNITLESKLFEMARPDILKILKVPRRFSVAQAMRKFYLADKEDLAKLAPVRNYLSGKNEGGQIVAPQALAPSRVVTKPSSESFARSAAAQETGSAAQAKNPRPRAGNSGDKNMSRDGGPA
jgi:hypothetical protein